MPIRMPYKAFCEKCGFVWTRGKGCVQCKIENTRRQSCKTVPKQATKPITRKVDKRKKKYRDNIRSKTIWELAELVMALDAVLEIDDFGTVILYEDQQERAGQIKRRVPDVMKNVQRAYELTKRYPTKSLKKIRQEFPLHITAYCGRKRRCSKSDQH